PDRAADRSEPRIARFSAVRLPRKFGMNLGRGRESGAHFDPSHWPGCSPDPSAREAPRDAFVAARSASPPISRLLQKCTPTEWRQLPCVGSSKNWIHLRWKWLLKRELRLRHIRRLRQSIISS